MDRTIDDIFPADYPHREDFDHDSLMIEVREHVDAALSPTQILGWLKHVVCPYMREALARLTVECWLGMVERGDEKAVYQNMDGFVVETWPTVREDIRPIIRQSYDEAYDLRIHHSVPQPEPEAEPQRFIPQPPKQTPIMNLNNCTVNIGQYVETQTVGTQYVSHQQVEQQTVKHTVPFPPENNYKSLVLWLQDEKERGKDWFADAGNNRSEMCRQLSDYLPWQVEQNSLRKALQSSGVTL